MRRRAAMLVAVLCLTLPLVAQEPELEVTIQFSGEKAETVSSFSWGVTSTSRQLVITKPVTELSGTLFLACTAGKHLPGVVITVAKKKGKGNAQEYYQVRMTDLLVSSFQQSGGDGELKDTISLSFANAEYTLIP